MSGSETRCIYLHVVSGEGGIRIIYASKSSNTATNVIEKNIKKGVKY